MPEYRKLARLLKALALGLAVGLAVLAVFLAPTLLRQRAETAAAGLRQGNLLPSRGEAFAAFDMAQASLTVLLDGRPHEGMAIAADRGFFAVPPDGRLSLPLAPGSYTFIAGYENRRLVFDAEIAAGRENQLVLEVNKAPLAPELRMWDVSMEEDIALALEIRGADKINTVDLPDGVSIEKQRGEFVLCAKGGSLGPGFWCFRLIAENQYGDAAMFACLRIPGGRDIIPIRNVAELDAIRRDLSGHYLLLNDIDLSEVENWRPIGTGGSPFCGVFDGGGYQISGLRAPPELTENDQFGLFGPVKNAILRNVIIREPLITPRVADRDLGNIFSGFVLAGGATQSLVENCASIGGKVSPSDGYASGLLGGVSNSVVLGCFNSTAVFCNMANRYLANTGGISGGNNNSYISRCANEGEVKGTHLTGGITGHTGGGMINRCVNSGYIWGSTIVGAVPVGGVIQANDEGSTVYSYFVRGQSPIGAHSSNGLIAAVVPIEASELRQPRKLPMLGSFSGDAPEWAYASLDAQGPVPYGIFRQQAPPPLPDRTGNRVVVLPVEGLRYFYAVDGGDPYTSCPLPVESLDVTLKQGQVLQVFAAAEGCRDSETVTIEGGK